MDLNMLSAPDAPAALLEDLSPAAMAASGIARAIAIAAAIRLFM
jgi:hypothetical protein